MEAYGPVNGRIPYIHMLFLLLSLVMPVSRACTVPQPKPSYKEECDCHYSGNDVSMTCYSDVECYNPNDTTYHYDAMWAGYYANDTDHDLSDESRYRNDKRSENLGEDLTRFMATLTISDVSDEDYHRRFIFFIDSDYRDMKDLLFLPILCNKTEMKMMIVDTPPNLIPIVAGLVAFLVVCALFVCCAVFNLPFLKYFLLSCRGRGILRKRPNTEHLKYDTALLYDTYDVKAPLIARSLAEELVSQGYDVSSADDVSGGEREFKELDLIPDSASVIFIVTQDSATDKLLTLARDIATIYKSSKEQILVHTDHVPSEFRQCKLLTLTWFEDVRKKKSNESQEKYCVVSTVESDNDFGNAPNGNANATCTIETHSEHSQKSKDNACFIFRVYRKWKQRKFYKALQLGLSTAFRVNNDKTSLQNTQNISVEVH
ncbi:uncharacterized protein LOC117341665 [Pecten maximus]|uniref:uncharacterized protein LOC117341665 n=1 Tax=Pecten maximus TaxID=6579 RepID=UPI001458AD44|nr:uncharacterized protein LOC117341665 [Pecten maximus]